MSGATTRCLECGVVVSWEQVEADAALAKAAGKRWPEDPGEPPEGNYPGCAAFPEPLCGPCGEYIMAENAAAREQYLLDRGRLLVLRHAESL